MNVNVEVEDFDKRYVTHFNKMLGMLPYFLYDKKTPKDEDLNDAMEMMNTPYYNYIKEHHTIPSAATYYKEYMDLYNGRELNDEYVEFDGLYGGRVVTTKKKLKKRLFLALTSFIRENKLLIGMYNRGLKAWYNHEEDRKGIDIRCEYDGVEVGIASYAGTKGAVAARAAKLAIHDYDIPVVDAPLVFKGNGCVQINGVYLYKEAYMDGIAEWIKSTARRINLGESE